MILLIAITFFSWRTLVSGVTCITQTEDNEVSLSMLMADGHNNCTYGRQVVLNIVIANSFCVILTCGHFSKTVAEAEAMVAMAPRLGMATARTSMAIAGGSGDDMAIAETGAS